MVNDATPLVSIAMSVRNSAKTLASSLGSICRQTYLDWELILIDDGSTDETLRVANQFHDCRIKIYAHGVSKGLPTRLNQAIGLARGKYIARMDGDDVAYPYRIERQVSYLEQHPEVDLVGAWVIVFGENGRLLGKRATPEFDTAICANPIAGFPMVHPTLLGKRDWFAHYQYDPAILRSQDQDLFLRSYRFSQFANVQEILLGYHEEKIDLHKLAKSRFYFTRSLLREFAKQGRPLIGLRGGLEQLAKAFVDLAAVKSGSKYRILRHRARPVIASEHDEWTKVRSALHSSNGVTDIDNE